MIALAVAFLTSTVGRIVGTALVVFVLLSAVYIKGSYDGSSACGARWKAVVAAEQARQVEANQTAKREELRVIAALSARNSELENKLNVLEREAADDPDADKPALNRGSVRRIDGVH